MRKLLKMFRENILFFLDFIFIIVTMVASVFVPDLVYGIYAGYLFMILDVYVLVEEKIMAKLQIVNLLLCVISIVMGQCMNSALCLYGLQSGCLLVWLWQFIWYLKYMEKIKK